MRTDERRRDDIRDEMLIDMARGIQILLSGEVGFRRLGENPLGVVGRLDAHIEHLKDAK